MKVKELIKLIEKEDREQTRMKGSNRQYRHPEKEGAVTVAGKPVPTYRQVPYQASSSRLF